MNKHSLFLIKILVLGLFFLGFSACGQKEKSLRVIATPVPHAEILESVKDELLSQGIPLEIIVVDDFMIPNRAVAQGDADACFFEHLPFLQNQIAEFGFSLVDIAKIEIEPMGLYSKKISTIADIKNAARISIPSDPTNEARALMLLHKVGLIELDDPQNEKATVLNVVQNPKKLQFLELDAAMVARTLEEVDLAAINTNFALEIGLVPTKDALVLEDKESPYVNVLVVRKGEETRQDIQALQKALTSEKTRTFIHRRYQGAIVPAF